MKKEEQKLQIDCVEWFDLQYPKLKQLLFAVPNGSRMTIGQAVLMKRMGLRKGVYDLFLSVPMRGFHGLYLEAKSSSGRVSDEQIKFATSVEKRGYAAREFRTFEQFVFTIKWYLNHVT